MGRTFFSRFSRWLRRLVWLAIVILAALLAFALLRPAPQDLPWTELDLGQPIGLFTGRKLTGLAEDGERCRALLRQAGVVTEAAPIAGQGQCGAADAVRIGSGQEMLALAPASVTPACPIVASMAVWKWQVVQPAAQRLLGASVERIEHLGSYSCRRLYGRSEGNWSEHATANAIDISAFVLTDGRRISVQRDWSVPGQEAIFLREVRDGACRLFATVLSPDYNQQHHDHLHLDQAQRGQMGWRACR
ncbi:conserved hypothetical protein [Sphingobium sp. SYK-6]|uniref:extensin-like domain-containing protein n=1 Tax=Sphingobium sp. (strain NBRC 103272 / SYK-6) TaxID=627192 RepID=UPI0002276E03|nr:extensin family protein [Sphingobium sp. SYK-6]BAK65631.1 conserved hypothetical protein [Sphingobium sp. SYK-6]